MEEEANEIDVNFIENYPWHILHMQLLEKKKKKKTTINSEMMKFAIKTHFYLNF